MKILINGLPPTDNHSYGRSRFGVVFLVKDAKDFKSITAEVCSKIKDCGKLFNDYLDVDITYYVKRDRDVLGCDKILMDAMQGIIFKNDSQILDAHLHKYKDKENPRVEVVIKKAKRKY